MYCLGCGKSIPTESRFCMFCGKPVQPGTVTPTSLMSSNAAPKYLKGLGCQLNGISERDKHGFRLWFQLVDAEGKPTASDGELEIKIGARYGWSKFTTLINVRKEDFRQSERDPLWFGYIFEQVEPKVTESYSRDGYTVDVVFRTPGNFKFKASSDLG